MTNANLCLLWSMNQLANDPFYLNWARHNIVYCQAGDFFENDISSPATYQAWLSDGPGMYACF